MSRIQQKRLYEAESCLWGHGKQFSSIEESTTYLDSVIQSEWFINQFGYLPSIKVCGINGKWAGAADRSKFTIYLKRYTENVVLHELSHLLCLSDEHNECFVSTFLHLIRNSMGFYAWAEFAYELGKVDYYAAS